MVRQIGLVAKALGVSASKLRYWDKKGLIRFKRNSENNYRTFSFQAMMDICDIIFYRDLSMSIDDIQKLSSKDGSGLNNILKQNRVSLQTQIEKLEKSVEKIDKRISAVESIEELKENFTIVKGKFSQINYFDFDNTAHVEIYLENPEETVVFLNCENPLDIKYGIFNESGDELRRADTEKKLYLQGLFWVSTSSKSSNLNEFIEEVKQRGFLPGNLVGEYLITTGGEVKKDYYIGKMELLKC